MSCSNLEFSMRLYASPESTACVQTLATCYNHTHARSFCYLGQEGRLFVYWHTTPHGSATSLLAGVGKHRNELRSPMWRDVGGPLRRQRLLFLRRQHTRHVDDGELQAGHSYGKAVDRPPQKIFHGWAVWGLSGALLSGPTPLLGSFGLLLNCLGPVSGLSWACLDCLRPVLGCLGPVLELSWVVLGLF